MVNPTFLLTIQIYLLDFKVGQIIIQVDLHARDCSLNLAGHFHENSYGGFNYNSNLHQEIST